MKSIKIYDYQMDKLDEIRKAYKGKLQSTEDVIGHLIRVFEITEQFYQEVENDEK
jgi:hypothetical protein